MPEMTRSWTASRNVGARGSPRRPTTRANPRIFSPRRSTGPCTRALQAVFDLMGYEYRHPAAPYVRKLLNLLADALTVTGDDGAQHRALIGPPALHSCANVAPGWG